MKHCNFTSIFVKYNLLILVLFLVASSAAFAINARDSDHDGVSDVNDECPDSAITDVVDVVGCARTAKTIAPTELGQTVQTTDVIQTKTKPYITAPSLRGYVGENQRALILGLTPREDITSMADVKARVDPELLAKYITNVLPLANTQLILYKNDKIVQKIDSDDWTTLTPLKTESGAHMLVALSSIGTNGSTIIQTQQDPRDTKKPFALSEISGRAYVDFENTYHLGFEVVGTTKITVKITTEALRDYGLLPLQNYTWNIYNIDGKAIFDDKTQADSSASVTLSSGQYTVVVVPSKISKRILMKKIEKADSGSILVSITNLQTAQTPALKLVAKTSDSRISSSKLEIKKGQNFEVTGKITNADGLQYGTDYTLGFNYDVAYFDKECRGSVDVQTNDVLMNCTALKTGVVNIYANIYAGDTSVYQTNEITVNIIGDDVQTGVKCIDLDGGQDYFTKSKASGHYSGSNVPVSYGFNGNTSATFLSAEPSLYYDHCATPTQLNEAYCDENGNLSSIGYSCPNGCLDGVCITNTTTPFYCKVPILRNFFCDESTGTKTIVATLVPVSPAKRVVASGETVQLNFILPKEVADASKKGYIYGKFSIVCPQDVSDVEGKCNKDIGQIVNLGTSQAEQTFNITLINKYGKDMPVTVSYMVYPERMSTLADASNTMYGPFGVTYEIIVLAQKEETCLSEGQSMPVIANPPPCCAGLNRIKPFAEATVGSMGICTAKCGNGVCDASSESTYNCHADCAQNADLPFYVNSFTVYDKLVTGPQIYDSLVLGNSLENDVTVLKTTISTYIPDQPERTQNYTFDNFNISKSSSYSLGTYAGLINCKAGEHVQAVVSIDYRGANSSYIKRTEFVTATECASAERKMQFVASNCADSDGGNNPYVFGKITKTDPLTNQALGITTDWCTGYMDVSTPDKNALREYYCNVNGTVDYTTISCPNGCFDGACVALNTTSNASTIIFTGRLVDQMTKEPIDGARLYSAYQFYPEEVITASDGSFKFSANTDFILTQGDNRDANPSAGWTFLDNCHGWSDTISVMKNYEYWENGQKIKSYPLALVVNSFDSKVVSRDITGQQIVDLGNVYAWPQANLQTSSDIAGNMDIHFKYKNSEGTNGAGQYGLTNDHYMSNVLPLTYDTYISFVDATGKQYNSSIYTVPTSAKCGTVTLKYFNGKSEWSVESTDYSQFAVAHDIKDNKYSWTKKSFSSYPGYAQQLPMYWTEYVRGTSGYTYVSVLSLENADLTAALLKNTVNDYMKDNIIMNTKVINGNQVFYGRRTENSNSDNYYIWNSGNFFIIVFSYNVYSDADLENTGTLISNAYLEKYPSSISLQNAKNANAPTGSVSITANNYIYGKAYDADTATEINLHVYVDNKYVNVFTTKGHYFNISPKEILTDSNCHTISVYAIDKDSVGNSNDGGNLQNGLNMNIGSVNTSGCTQMRNLNSDLRFTGIQINALKGSNPDSIVLFNVADKPIYVTLHSITVNKKKYPIEMVGVVQPGSSYTFSDYRGFATCFDGEFLQGDINVSAKSEYGNWTMLGNGFGTTCATLRN